jgi:hypothetical protein
MTMALYAVREDPLPSWRSSLSGDGIDVTGDLTRALVAKHGWRVKKSFGTDLVTGKQYS